MTELYETSTSANTMRSTYYLRILESSTGQIAIADLSRFRKGYLMTRINVPRAFRGRGIGTELMQMILADADRTCSVIYIHPLAQDPAWQERLVAWYEKFGFRAVPHRDGELIRSPDPDSMRGEEAETAPAEPTTAAAAVEIDYDYDFGISEITDAFAALEATKVYGRLVEDITARFPGDSPEFWAELRKATKEMMRLIEAEMMRQLGG